MGTDVNIHFLSDSSRARRDITELQGKLGDLGISGERTRGQLAEIGTGLSEARQTAEREVPLIRQLASDIGNIFKVALFDVPVGFVKETANILGNQRPPRFISNLQEQIKSTQTATEEAIRPIATLNTILGALEADFVTTSTATDFFTVSATNARTSTLASQHSLARKRREYIELVRDGATPADTALSQLSATIETLEGKSNSLSREVSQLQKNIASADVETRNMRSSTEAFGVALSSIDTRFLSYQERVAAYTGAIRELPPAITAVSDAFDVLAPTAARVNAIFDDLNTSLVDSQLESELLDAVTQKIIQDLQDLEGLAHVRAVIAERTDVHNANLINQAVSEGVVSLREYVNVMGEVQGEFETTDAISDRLTQSIRDQASAFDELSRSAGQASQGVGSGVFDQFNAQTPGSGASAAGADPYSAAIAIGVEQSQALHGYAGGQIRDENIQTALETGERPGGFDTFLGNLDLITEGFGGLEEFDRRQNQINDAINENLRRQQEAENQAITTGVIRGRNAEGISNALGITSIDSISNFVGQLQGDQFIDPAVLTQVYQPFIDGLQRGMESAGDSLQHAIGQGFDETVISSRVDDLAEDTTRFYDLQIEAVRAAAALAGNDPRNAVFALVQERDRIINDATNQLRSFALRVLKCRSV